MTLGFDSKPKYNLLNPQEGDNMRFTTMFLR